jgi:hypothetical protein
MTEPHQNLDRELVLSAQPAFEAVQTPTAELLRRFNPKLVGFGIVNPPVCYFPGPKGNGGSEGGE